MESSAETAVWFMERVVVELIRNGSVGTIKEVNSDNSAKVELDDGQSLLIQGAKEVRPVPPKEHDKVLVTGDTEVGVEGELVCIDGTVVVIGCLLVCVWLLAVCYLVLFVFCFTSFY